jgi:hypothetical protein
MWKRLVITLVIVFRLSPAVTLAQPASIDAALADLNARLGTAVTRDQLDNWTWAQQRFNDTSLGCPQPDQGYAQALTRGYIFTFTYDNIVYDYRADEQGSFFLCSITPLPIMPTQIPPTPTLVPVFPTGEVITPANSAQVIEVERIAPPAGTLGSLLVWTRAYIVAAAGASTAAPTAGGLLLYDANDLNAEPARIELNTPVTALAAVEHDDLAHLAAGTLDGSIVLMPAAPEPVDVLVMEPTAGFGAPNHVAISPDFGYVAAAYGDLSGAAAGAFSVVEIWDAENGAPLRVFEHSAAVGAVAFSPDGTILASGDAQGIVRVWNITESTVIQQLPPQSGAIRSLSFSPDGRLIASGSTDGTTQVWDLRSDSLAAGFVNTTDDAVLALAFSLDGSLLATTGGNPNAATRDNSVRLWDIAGLAVAGGLLGHDTTVGSVAFSPDGTRIATLSEDGTLRLWAVADDAAG